jgi:hypothetical protein
MDGVLRVDILGTFRSALHSHKSVSSERYDVTMHTETDVLQEVNFPHLFPCYTDRHDS